MNYTIYSLPLIAAVIGWFTNFLAIKMLFHPKKPINILGLKIQGIFPKRHHVLAQKIGALVANELFSISDIKDKIIEADQKELLNVIDNKIDDYLRNKLTASMPMLSMFINDDIVNKIKGTMVKEFEDALPEILTKFVDNIEKGVNIEDVVKEKVEKFSLDKLEHVLFSIMSNEFKFIEIVGAVLGFVIGLIQVVIVHLA